MNSTHALGSTQQPRGSANHLRRTGIAQQPVKASRLYGLPCTKCGAYYFSDEPSCPICERHRVNNKLSRGTVLISKRTRCRGGQRQELPRLEGKLRPMEIIPRDGYLDQLTHRAKRDRTTRVLLEELARLTGHTHTNSVHQALRLYALHRLGHDEVERIVLDWQLEPISLEHYSCHCAERGGGKSGKLGQPTT